MPTFEGSEPIGLAPDGKTIIDGNGRAVGSLSAPLGYSDLLAEAMEFLGTPFNLAQSDTEDSFSNGTIQGVLVPVKAGIPLVGVRLFMVQKGTGGNPTGYFLGITDLDGTRRATTGNIVTDPQLKAAGHTFVNFDFLAPWTPAEDGVVIGCGLADGSYGGQDPTYATNLGFGGISPVDNWPAASFDYATASGAYTDIPDPVPDWGPGSGAAKWLTFYTA